MKKYIFTHITILLVLMVLMFFAIQNSFAACVYDQQLSVEDFDMGNMLTWSTSSETNNKAFEVQKSLDGVKFVKIGKVKGAGTISEKQEYRFLDVSAAQGKTYYRLKQIDLDDKFYFSDVVIVSKETANNFTIISMTPPSDEDNLFEITVNAISEDELDYKVFDMRGNLVYRQKQQLKKGINIITIDLSEISGDDTDTGFAGNNDLLGDKVGYKVSLEGVNEAEMLTIAPRNKDVKTGKEVEKKKGN